MNACCSLLLLYLWIFPFMLSTLSKSSFFCLSICLSVVGIIEGVNIHFHGMNIWYPTRFFSWNEVFSSRVHSYRKGGKWGKTRTKGMKHQIQRGGSKSFFLAISEVQFFLDSFFPVGPTFSGVRLFPRESYIFYYEYWPDFFFQESYIFFFGKGML